MLDKSEVVRPGLAPVSPLNLEGVSVEEEPAKPSPLQWGARCLVDAYVVKTGRFPTRADGSEEVSRSNALLRVHAAAAAMANFQKHSLQSTLSLVRKLVKVGALRAIAFLEHVLYDETQLQVRIEFNEEPEKQIGRVWVVEHSWMMLLQEVVTASGSSAALPLQHPFMVLQGSCSPGVRGSANATGETIHQVLNSATDWPEGIASDFEQLHRLVETDDNGANFRAEALVGASRRPQSPKDAACQTLHSVCLCHKVHAGALKAWPLHAEVVQGLVHTCKTMSISGHLKRFKDALTVVVQRRLLVQGERLLDPDATNFRQKNLAAFIPPERHPRRRALALAVAGFYNGDWRIQTHLEHRCAGITCCRTPEISILKGTIFLRKLAGTLFPSMFNRANWLGWHVSLAWFGLGAAIHGVFQQAFQEAFGRDTVPDIPAEPQSASAAGSHDMMEEPLQPSSEANVAPGRLANDQFEQMRQENAVSQRIALSFVKAPMLESVFMMRMSLDAEIRLMQSLVHQISRVWEQEQQKNMLDHGRRQFRMLRFHEGEDFKAFLGNSWTVFMSETLWKDYSQTERFRSDLFKNVFRPASVVWQLAIRRCQGYPYKLFRFLSSNNADFQQAFANEVLHETPSCMLDSWTRSFLSIHDTIEKLCSPEAQQILTLVAVAACGSTYSTERLHSCNLRRAKSRLTHAPDIQHLGLGHMGSSGPPWLPSLLETAPSARPRGRPRKNKVAKRRGGGGAWRAFCHMQMGGQSFSKETVQALAEAYHKLSPEQKQIYVEMGKAGPCIKMDQVN